MKQRPSLGVYMEYMGGADLDYGEAVQQFESSARHLKIKLSRLCCFEGRKVGEAATEVCVSDGGLQPTMADAIC